LKQYVRNASRKIRRPAIFETSLINPEETAQMAKKKRKGLVTQATYAKSRGVTPARVNQLVKSGIIRLHSGLVDPEEADKAVAAASDPARDSYRKLGKMGRPHEAGGGSGSEYRRAATQEKYWSAVLKRLKAEEEQGRLVDAEELKRELMTLFTTIKTRIRSIAPKCAQEIAHLKASKMRNKELIAAIQAILKKEHDDALSELSQYRVDTKKE